MERNTVTLVQNGLKKRHCKEAIFRFFAVSCVVLALSFLVILFGMIISKGYSAFLRTQIAVEVDLSEKSILRNSDIEDFSKVEFPDLLEQISYRRLIKKSLREKFPDAKGYRAMKDASKTISNIAAVELREKIKSNPDLIGKKSTFWFSASSSIDIYFKHDQVSSLTERQITWADNLIKNKQLRTVINWKFFEFADSREPEIAGIGAGLKGSFLVMLIFLSCAFPIGVMCAFYLEEFAPKNHFTDIIEVSINNLAAVPSIIYGLLGLTVYLQFFCLPRSSALVGGMTLFMLVLPVIIIATRNTIRSIPDSIRDAAMALGASKMQVVLHHLLPLSIPGIMTGTILAVSRALGETAPLLMIGMVAFIADIPKNFTDPTTVLPVQIYLWSDSPEAGFAEKTSAAILVLLTVLILFNFVAVVIRKKFEKKW